MTRWANSPETRKNIGIRTGSMTSFNQLQAVSVAPGTPVTTCM